MERFVESFNPWSDEPRETSWHDVAQICLNGHVVNRATKQSPQLSKKFCSLCGAPTLTHCERCKNEIQGEYHMPGIVAIGFSFPAPPFCSHCGAPFPWTEAKLQAARDLTQELDGLTPTEKEALSKSLDDLVKDTPQTQVAATRFKKLLSKASKEGGAALREILVSVLSETAKKTLGLP